MLTLTTRGLEKQAQKFMESIHHGQFKVNGVVIDNAPLYKKERSGTTIRIYLTIGHEYSGTVSEIQMIDQDGEVVAKSSETIAKPDGKGIYVTFKYKYTEQEGLVNG